MTGLIIPHNAWVVVCDGGRARFLQNHVHAPHAHLVLMEEMVDHHNASTSAQGSDKPGRMSTPAGPISAMEGSDYHERGEAEFLARVLETMTRHVKEHGIEHVVLAAPPRALGVLRQIMPDTLKVLILAEMNKDYTRHSLPELEKLLKAA